MQQIAENARDGGPVRLQPVTLRPRPLPANPLQPGALASIGRRPRAVEALVWLWRLLLVRPIGRRARADRLGRLSDRALRDIGMLRADAHATALGMVPLQEVLPSYPGEGCLVAGARRGQPLSLVRMGKAA